MSRSDEDAESDYERRLVNCVKKDGWFCVKVFDPDGKQPSFAYSVGFTQTLSCPEFIVFGLGVDLMHSMLRGVYEQINAGKTPEDHQIWSELIQGYDCISRKLHPTNIVRDYLNSAMWYWGNPEKTTPLEAFQLVWPSNGPGLFPWDKDCSQIVRDAQPPLYLPNLDRN